MSKEKTFDDLMKEALSQNSPSFPLAPDLGRFMIWALNFASPITLGISGSEMRVLHHKLENFEDLNCYEYAVASNNLEAHSVTELEITWDEYFTLMEELEKYATQFNQDTMDIRNAVIAEMSKKHMRKISN